jgi:hypothetical protein
MSAVVDLSRRRLEALIGSDEAAPWLRGWCSEHFWMGIGLRPITPTELRLAALRDENLSVLTVPDVPRRDAGGRAARYIIRPRRFATDHGILPGLDMLRTAEIIGEAPR